MDLAALGLLPDSVKRRILLHMADTQAPPAPIAASTDSCAQPVPPAGAPIPSGRSQTLDTPGRTAALPQLPSLRAGVAVVDGFISMEQVQAVVECAKIALEEQQRQAGMGGSLLGWKDTQARGDLARWLHAEDERKAGRHALADLVERMTLLQAQLAASGYDVGGRATYQLACYPGNGARYVRHADRSSSAPSRRVTAICYLNNDWTLQDGGQLAVYTHSPRSTDDTHHSNRATDTRQSSAAGSSSNGGTLPACDSAFAHHPPVGHEGGEPALLVAPLGGRLLVFDSAIDHEVLPSHSHRWAVTAWFHCASPAAPATPQPRQAATTIPSTPPQPATASSQPLTAATQVADAKANSTCQVNPAGPGLQRTPATSELQLLPRPLPQPLIFVSIAAYRDPECQFTIRDLFLRARRPDRVRVGVCWQVTLPDDAAFVRVAGTGASLASHSETTAANSTQPRQSPNTRWLNQVREIKIPASEATGPCKARYLAAQLWAGEEYFLQIDAHMRFVEGWDELCIQQLSRAEALLPPEECYRGAVLTTYPADYEGCGFAAVAPEGTQPALLCVSGFDADGMLRTRGRMLTRGWEQTLACCATTSASPHGSHQPAVDLTAASASTPRADNTSEQAAVRQEAQCPGVTGSGVTALVRRVLSQRRPGDPLPCAGWAAGFSFSRAEALVRHAPYPPPDALPHLFFGEELYMYARLYTRGYECFSPGAPVCFHQWDRSAREHTLQKAVRNADASTTAGSVTAATVASPTEIQQAGQPADSLGAVGMGVGVQGEPQGQVCSSAGLPDQVVSPVQAMRVSSRQKVLSVLGLAPWPDQEEATLGTDNCGRVADGRPPEWREGGAWGVGIARSVRDLGLRCGVDLGQRVVVGDKQQVLNGWLPEAVFDK